MQYHYMQYLTSLYADDCEAKVAHLYRNPAIAICVCVIFNSLGWLQVEIIPLLG